MRTFKTSVVVCSMWLVPGFLASSALAQDVEPEAVDLEESGDEAPAADAAAPADEDPPMIGEATAEPEPAAPEPPPAAEEEAPVVQMQATGSLSTAAGADASAAAGTPVDRSYGGPTTDADDEWKVNWFGYFRAPMKIGIGSREDEIGPQAEKIPFVTVNRFAGDAASPSNQVVYDGMSDTTLSAPRVPDDQFLNWSHTRANETSWAELFFNYGNSWASGTLGLQGFNFTDSSFNDQDAQFGFGQGYVTLTPDTSDIVEGSSLTAKFGSFWTRHGAAGKYDAGQYDTHIAGKTHTMGFMWHPEFAMENMVLWFEHGFGTRKPNPDSFNNTLFTLLHHAHAGIVYDNWIEANLHYLNSWTQEPAHLCQVGNNTGSCTGPGAYVGGAAQPSEPVDGSMTVYGLDLTFDFGAPGRLFVGGSLIDAEAAETVGPAIEVIHAFGGGFFNSGIVGQYFVRDGQNQIRDRGYGTITTLSAQYDLSISSLSPETFGEQAVNLSLFAMMNKINVDEDAVLAAATASGNGNITAANIDAEMEAVDGITKLKAGMDIEWSPAAWFGVGLRGDHVRPNSEISEQTFSIISPRIVFRSDFSTHEEILIGYSRYLYAEQTCALTAAPGTIEARSCVQPPGGPIFPDGFGATPGFNQSADARGAPSQVPHTDTIRVQAKMWF